MLARIEERYQLMATVFDGDQNVINRSLPAPCIHTHEEGRHPRGMMPTFFYETEGEERVCIVLTFVSHIHRILPKGQKFVE